MSYEYTDGHGQTIKIRKSESGHSVVASMARDEVYIKADEVPALALALLVEVGTDRFGVGSASDAVRALEKEIEKNSVVRRDRVVAEFAETMAPSTVPFDQMEEHSKHMWREQYRKAQKFFGLIAVESA